MTFLNSALNRYSLYTGVTFQVDDSANLELSLRRFLETNRYKIPQDVKNLTHRELYKLVNRVIEADQRLDALAVLVDAGQFGKSPLEALASLAKLTELDVAAQVFQRTDDMYLSINEFTAWAQQQQVEPTTIIRCWIKLSENSEFFFEPLSNDTATLLLRSLPDALPKRLVERIAEVESRESRRVFSSKVISPLAKSRSQLFTELLPLSSPSQAALVSLGLIDDLVYCRFDGNCSKASAQAIYKEWKSELLTYAEYKEIDWRDKENLSWKQFSMQDWYYPEVDQRVERYAQALLTTRVLERDELKILLRSLPEVMLPTWMDNNYPLNPADPQVVLELVEEHQLRPTQILKLGYSPSALRELFVVLQPLLSKDATMLTTVTKYLEARHLNEADETLLELLLSELRVRFESYPKYTLRLWEALSECHYAFSSNSYSPIYAIRLLTLQFRKADQSTADFGKSGEIVTPAQ